MRKKLLSLFVVFCMLLGMVPAIFANEITDALGIKEEDVSMYVSEDTVLTENVEGLVLVTAPVRVTIDGAKLETGLVLAPSAGDATVTIANAADVNAVVVLSEATVTIEASAAVANIDVSAANADVEVAGTVGSITVEADAAGAQVVVAQAATVTTVAVAAANVSVDVAGTVSTVSVAQTAASAKVTVEQTATVSTVSVAGSNASVDVAGSVKTVTVSQTAASANINVEKSATVSNVNVAAKDVTIEVSGTVESVNVAESATGAQLVANEGANVSKVTDATGELEVSGEAADAIPEPTAPAEDETYDEPEDEHPEQDDSSAGTENQYADAQAFADQIKGAPLVDWTGGKAGKPTEDGDPSYKVTAKATSKKDITVTAKGNVKPHTPGGDAPEAKWIGIAIPKTIVANDPAEKSEAAPDATAAAAAADVTRYYVFLIYKDEEGNGYKVKALENDDETDDSYTYYFNGENAAKTEEEYYRIGVIKEEDLDRYIESKRETAEAGTGEETAQAEGEKSALDILAGLLAGGEEELAPDEVNDVLKEFDFILHIKYEEDPNLPEVPGEAAASPNPNPEDNGDGSGSDQITEVANLLDEAYFLGTVEDIIGSTEDAEDEEKAEEAEGAEIDLLFPAFDLAVLPVPVIKAPAVEAAATTEAPVEEPEEEAEPEDEAEPEETEDEAVEEAEEPEIEAEEPAED